MTEMPTEEDFRRHVGTKFGVQVESPRPLELELVLVEVKSYETTSRDEKGMERYSLFFQGPGDVMLKQGTYTFTHEGMGERPLFIVPVAQNERGFRYEVVFNYFKKK